MIFPPPTRHHTQTINARHGRIERRILYTSVRLNDYVDWPQVGQALCVDRRRIRKKTGTVMSQERHFYVTSLTSQRAKPVDLLALCRGHWTIENKSHYVRDVTFSEDASQVRKGALPPVMAAFRNLVLTALRRFGIVAIRPILIRNAAYPFRVLAYLWQ